LAARLFLSASPAQKGIMKKFKVTFYLNGHGMSTTIEATSQSQAISLIKNQYPGATSISASETR